ncbi:MAG: SBBP repeat-containing protein, partial [Gemmatimonadales bacterium]
MGNGTAIVVGSSQSADFPGAGAVQGPSDAFIVAFGPDGRRLWSRLIGSSGYERAYAVEIAPSGDIVIGGRAGGGLPALAGSFQPNFNGTGPATGYGPQDGFVCTLSPADGAPKWCSYLGPSTGIVRDLAVGTDGSIYLASVQDIGEVWPAGWTIRDLRTDLSQPRNTVLAKVSADGTNLAWLSQLDGTGTTPSVRVGADGAPVVIADLAQDIRVTSVAPDGRTTRYKTDVGGSDIEWTETHQLALDAAGNAYVTGYTRSGDLSTSSGAYDRSFNGGTGDAFVVKLSPAGQLLAGTFLGGSGTERAEGIALDGAGNVYLSGYTSSGDFPVTVALPADGGDEVFMTSLTP